MAGNSAGKKSRKAVRRQAKKLKTIMAVSFEEVNGRHNVLVAAFGRCTKAVDPKQKYGAETELSSGQKVRRGHTVAKATSIELGRHDVDDPNTPYDLFNARVSAVKQFLGRASKSTQITLVVSDDKFTSIVNSDEPVASEAIEAWNKFCEKRNIEVVTSLDDLSESSDNGGNLSDEDKLSCQTLMELSQATLKSHRAMNFPR